MPFTVLSIQSHVVAGHLGNDAAAFALQRLGVEVWPIHTVQFSNHPGHGAWTGQTFDAAHMRSLIDGLDARGYLRRVDAVLSGYIGTAETGAVIAEAVARVKAQNTDAIYCCDPVMGDVGRGLFVKPDVPPFFVDIATSLADIATPNVFELSLLAGMSASALLTVPGLVAAARALVKRCPRVVLVTGAHVTGDDRIATLAVTPERAWRVSTPYIPLTPMPNGMGDCIAAFFLGRYLQHYDIALALSQSVSSLYALVRGADVNTPRDLNLIAVQDALVKAPETFSAEL